MAKDFAFHPDTGSVDIWSGSGGKDSKLLHRGVAMSRLEDHPVAHREGISKDDVAYGIETAGRSDWPNHVIVPSGSRRPGKFRKGRHGGE